MVVVEGGMFGVRGWIELRNWVEQKLRSQLMLKQIPYNSIP